HRAVDTSSGGRHERPLDVDPLARIEPGDTHPRCRVRSHDHIELVDQKYVFAGLDADGAPRAETQGEGPCFDASIHLGPSVSPSVLHSVLASRLTDLNANDRRTVELPDDLAMDDGLPATKRPC